MATGLLRPLERPERGVVASLLYPLRGADSMAVVMTLTAGFWAVGALLPEYCLMLMATAESTGHGLLGLLIALVTVVPFVLLSPFVACYALQYLGRVLVSSAMGETVPPRSPDRNFDGFLSGLGPWFIWLVLGFGVGLGPSLSILAFSQPRTPAALWTALGLGVFGSGYALMALMIALLHDHSLAATPFEVVGAILRTAVSFVGRCLAILGLIAAVLATFLAAIALRDNSFGISMLVRLAGCGEAVWVSIVAMRILGTFAYHRRGVLGWHTERPRWGVTWGI